jgi:dipeptidyl aminopeptidase/acylaminoacyl peptidase
MNGSAPTALALLLLAPAYAQPHSATADLVRALDETVEFRDIAISPDGARIAWVQSGAVYSISWRTASARPAKLAGAVGHSAASPVWSPDSGSLAFFSDAGEKNGQMQLWIASGGAAPHKRTNLKGYAESPRWLPDGRRIAFLYTEGGPGGGPLTAAPAQTGVIDAAIHNARIAVLDVQSGKLILASPPDLNVYEFDVSPDGREFVGTAAPGPADNNWWIGRLYRFDAASGRATVIYEPKLQIAVPRWSPDGKQIAFLEGLMSDFGFFGGDLMTVPAGGSAAVNHTGNRKSSPSSLAWIGPERLLFTEWHGSGVAISTLDTNTGAIDTQWSGPESIHADGFQPNFALSRDGTASAVVRSSFNTPPEIWAGPIGDWKQLTHDNQRQQPSWGEAKAIEWPSEQYTIHGWLLPPAHIEAGRRYPLIVWVHGGPSSIMRPSWPSELSVLPLLASRGYFVLMPNPRGSYGQGEAFTRANVKDFGGGDLREIMAGVDYTIAHFPIDPERLGITGWSYGGFMTMFAVTQTDRFKAAMAGAGIANWTSYYGENLIDQWMIPFFGASVYDDPAVYEKSSPIHFIKRVKTPTLVIVGERDAECPSPQSFEFWHALKTLRVPTQLVVYPGEGHRFVQLQNRTDRDDRTLAWFDKYLVRMERTAVH